MTKQQAKERANERHLRNQPTLEAFVRLAQKKKKAPLKRAFGSPPTAGIPTLSCSIQDTVASPNILPLSKDLKAELPCMSFESPFTEHRRVLRLLSGLSISIDLKPVHLEHFC